jgi:hypothetical protein
MYPIQLSLLPDLVPVIVKDRRECQGHIGARRMWLQFGTVGMGGHEWSILCYLGTPKDVNNDDNLLGATNWTLLKLAVRISVP